jgi:glycosyltransferase involved in cell wall biosynthesis
MKVLWISQNVPYPPKSGVLLRNYNLIRLTSRFAAIDLLAIVKKNAMPSSYAEMAVPELLKLCSSVEAVRLPAEESRIRLLWVLLKSLFTRAPFTVNWAMAPSLKEALNQALSGETYDLIYFDSISLAEYRHQVASTAKVLNHHNIESQLFERRIAYEPNVLKRLYLRLEAKKLRRYESSVVGDFNSNLVVSSLDGQRLAEFCAGATTALVANGVDVDYFRLSDETAAEPGHLIMVSGMNWFPNLDAVLYMTETIWPILTKSTPGVRLTIVGARPPQRVLDLAAKDPRITVTGFVDDIRPYMDRAQVYLCPMRDGGGTRLKILDALSMGKPIVATTMALEGIDVVQEQDVLVGDTPEDFVNQVQRLIQDQSLRRRLSANGRAFVERHFSWEVIGKQLEGAFRKAIAERSRRG